MSVSSVPLSTLACQGIVDPEFRLRRTDLATRPTTPKRAKPIKASMSFALLLPF